MTCLGYFMTKEEYIVTSHFTTSKTKWEYVIANKKISSNEEIFDIKLF